MMSNHIPSQTKSLSGLLTMKLCELYRDGLITFEEYHQKLMAKLDAAIKKADKYLQEKEVKCTR